MVKFLLVNRRNIVFFVLHFLLYSVVIFVDHLRGIWGHIRNAADRVIVKPFHGVKVGCVEVVVSNLVLVGIWTRVVEGEVVLG